MYAWAKTLPSDIVVFFGYLTELGVSEIWLVPPLLIWVVLKWKKALPIWQARMLFLFSSVAIAGALNLILKSFFGRPRPVIFEHYGLYAFEFFQKSSHYLSFPSGHSNTIFAAMTVLGLWIPKYRVYFFVCAALVAFSRIATSKHYLSDVLFGSFVGVAWVLSWAYVWRKKGWLWG